MNNKQDHYFSKSPEVKSAKKSFAFDFLDKRYIFNTDKGVFAGSYLDKGTQILLAESVPWLQKRIKTGSKVNIVDLGCGYGPIATILQSNFEESNFFGIEINERAIALAKENFKQNRLNIKCYESLDEYVEENETVDFIISNPPVKIGKKLLYELMLSWLNKVEIGALIVMQKHLGSDSFIEWCNQQGFNAKKIASKKGFRIIEILK